MVSRIENQALTHFDAPKPVKQTPDSGEVFSISLDKGMLQELLGELNKLGVDTSKFHVEDSQGRQVSANSQILNTPTATAASVSSSRISLFDPRPGRFGSTTSPSGAPPAASQPANQPFAPKFEQDVQVKDVYGESWNLNQTYFATPETAAWLANKYGTGEVITQELYGGNGNPFGTKTPELLIKLHNGALVNAGLLASYYNSAPESQFPGLADQMIRAQFAREYGPDAV